MEPAIEIKGVSKTYAIFQPMERYLALRDVLTALVRAPLRIFIAKARRALSGEQAFLALNDASLVVRKGEIMGVIGANGAGKSTLLKILNRITEPTRGEVVIHGSISALLEVGTGFHPELTGRENIYFSGAILGMRRREIEEKFDRIVEFAEVRPFLDTPVKRYSSGMQVRLAFSVAIHMEPDILLIDEVLAVGDAAFQKKCLDKIHEAARKDGRTILFVSHNLDVVESLCDRVAYLERGSVKMVGEPSEAVAAYLADQSATTGGGRSEVGEDRSKKYQLLSATLIDAQGAPTTSFMVGEPIRVSVEYQNREPKSVFWLQAQCVSEQGTLIFTSADFDKNPEQYVTGRAPGRYRAVFTVPSSLSLALNGGRYVLSMRIPQDPSIELSLGFTLTDERERFGSHPGVLAIGEPWAIERIDTNG